MEERLAEVIDSKTFKLKYSDTLGIFAMVGRGFGNPIDSAISKDGHIYVVSRSAPFLPDGVRIAICTIDHDYLGEFGTFGYEDGQFAWPTSVAFDANNNLYLSDEYTHCISIFTKDGNFLKKWGIYGDAEGQLNGPSGLAFDTADNLFIVDHQNHRIQKFTKDGNVIDSWGTFGNKEGQFNLPWGITLDKEDNVYVADWRNDRIQKFTSKGKHIATVGSSGSEEGQLNRPSSVAVDSEGNIFVADWGNERIQIFDPKGQFLLKLRGQATLSKWAQEFMDSNSDEATARANSNLEPQLDLLVNTPYEQSSYIEKYFWGPVSVKIDSNDKLYVTETNRHRVQIYQKY